MQWSAGVPYQGRTPGRPRWTWETATDVERAGIVVAGVVLVTLVIVLPIVLTLPSEGGGGSKSAPAVPVEPGPVVPASSSGGGSAAAPPAPASKLAEAAAPSSGVVLAQQEPAHVISTRVDDMLYAATGSVLQYSTPCSLAPMVEEGLNAIPRETYQGNYLRETDPPGVPRLDDLVSSLQQASASASHIGKETIGPVTQGAVAAAAAAGGSSLLSTVMNKAGGQLHDAMKDGAYTAPGKPHVICVLSTGCGWCKKFMKETLAAAASLPCDVWWITHGEMSKVPPLQGQTVTGFPTSFAVRSDGTVAKSVPGAPKDVVSFLQSLVEAAS